MRKAYSSAAYDSLATNRIRGRLQRQACINGKSFFQIKCFFFVFFKETIFNITLYFLKSLFYYENQYLISTQKKFF